MRSERKLIRVFEHSYLRIGEQGFTQDHYLALICLNEQYGNQYFSIGYQKVKFNSFVGVLQVKNLILEILPKADRHGSTEKWRRALLTMLKVCHGLDLRSVSDAYLALRRASLLDLYVGLFLKEVEGLVHKGLVKQYRKRQGNLPALKGKLIFSRQLQKNFIHQERFFTGHQVYDQDTLINQVLKRALAILKSSNISTVFHERLNHLLLRFEQIQDLSVGENHFIRLETLNRKTVSYAKALRLAKLIILNYCPDLSTGSSHAIALLFDMNKLFEAYVLQILKKEMGTGVFPGLTILSQRRKIFWGSQGIIPDIIIEHNGDEKIVIDTKWKVIWDSRPADADLKQMFAYNVHFGAETSILLYPNPFDHQPRIAAFENSVYLERVHQCGLYFVNLFDEAGNAVPKAGHDLLNSIMTMVENKVTRYC